MLTQRNTRDGGGINLVKISLVLGLVAVGYFGYIYVPLILDYFGMKKAVRVGANVAYSQRSVDAVKKSIMNSFKELNMQDQYFDQNMQKIATTPTNFTADDIEVDISKSPPQVSVSIHYTRRIVWPFTTEEKTVDYQYAHVESLEDIKW